jgi:predicted RNA binding protein YcfA (HicA-like mRNA interferase family)
VTSKELLKKLLAAGWVIDRVHGSHHVMKKDNMTEIIPIHNKDIATGLLNKILKRAGLK